MVYPEPQYLQPPRQVRIGVWGPPGSGKTSFLAALKIATIMNRTPGNWIMNGSDDASSDFLIQLTNQLAEQKTFPGATFDPVGLIFRFTGEPPARSGGRFRPAAAPQAGGGGGGGGARRLMDSFRRRPETPVYDNVPPPPPPPPPNRLERITFELDILDVPGKTFGPDRDPGFGNARPRDDIDIDGAEPDGLPAPMPMDARAGWEERLLEHLQDCQGIVYLYDPVRDAKEGDAFLHFHGIMEKLSRRVFEQDSYQGARLPHHVAVCVTKFDAPDVYKVARRFGYSVQEAVPPYMPRVSNQQAREFFMRLCQESGGNAQYVVQGIPQHFSRVGYFVTSAVGFYVGPNNRVQPHNAINVEGNRIKGRVTPINVLEPILWLHESLSSVQ